jgi:nicotinamidase-related amidase
MATGFQNDFVADEGALAATSGGVDAIQAMLPEAARVLAAAREAGWLVVHLPERTLRDGMSDSDAWRAQRALNGWRTAFAAEGSWGERFVEGFEPEPGELVVERSRPGALVDTRASVLLRSAGASRVVLVGVETHRSILATAIQAVCLDYEVVVPIQAVASADEALARAAVDVLRSWAQVVDVDSLVAEAAPAREPAAVAVANELEG